MSERPFMQLYVSDFIGDTLQLSTEQIGAYMLLLMAMWNAGGKLPADDAKLARVVRMSLKKWRAVSGDLMPFFEGDANSIWHNRLTKELQKSESKSQSRAYAGAAGGRAKALKDIKPAVANASDMPQHLPEAISHIAATQLASVGKKPDRYDDLLDKLLGANGVAGFREERNPGLLNVGPIIVLIEGGLDLDKDILPAIRANPKPNARTWQYLVPQIEEYAFKRRGVRDRLSSLPAPANVDWASRMDVWRKDGTWTHLWGPKPGERHCRVPAELMEGTAA